MQSAVRRARFSPKGFLSSHPARGHSLKRTYATGSGSSQQVPRGRNTGLVLAGTALFSAGSGYFLATYELQKSGSARGTEETRTSGLDNTQYGTARDFCEAIKELKATFPEPGAVSDDPGVLGPYGFSENDYHPGNLRFFTDVDSR